MKKLLLFISFSLVIGTIWCQNYKSIHQEELLYHKSLNISNYEDLDLAEPMSPKSSNTRSCDLTRKVFGFHPSWNGDVYLNYDWNLISDFCYFAWEFSPTTGQVTNSNNWATTASVTTAQNNGVRVHLCVPMFTNHAAFLTSSTAMNTMITNLIAAMQLRGAIGVNIDFELVPVAQKANLTSFMTQLSNQVKAQIPGAIISVALPAVDWSAVWDIPNLVDYVDWFVIMGYDYYYSSSTSAGPVGPLYTFETSYPRNMSRSVTYYLSQGVAKENLILALPYYGREWSTTSNAVPSSTIANISSRTYKYVRDNPSTYSSKKWEPNSFTPYYVYNTGTEWRQCFVDDEVSIKKKYDLVNIRDLGGIGIWALGYDDGYTELWDAIEEKFTTCSAVPCSDTIWDLGGPTRTYNNLEDFTYTISPQNASSLSLQFNNFTLFNGGDTLWIYDGNSTASSLINSYTGTNSPGLVQSSGPNLTVRFKSNSADAAAGWQAIWHCISDNTAPITSISVNRNWQSGDFEALFSDSDNGSIKYRFYQVMDYNGTEWRANNDYGFFNDNFQTAINSDWTNSAGTWSITSNHLIQTNQASPSGDNTNLYASVVQDSGFVYLYNYQMKISGTGSNRRAGIHFFCSDPTQTNRDSSYMVYLRVDSDLSQVYKSINNTMTLVSDDITEVNADQWYDIKIIFNTITGEISVYKDNLLVSSWIDADPFTSGNSISLRSGNCQVEYDDFKVFVSRESSAIVSVGPESTNQVRYQSPNTNQDAARIRTIIVDEANNWSESVSENVFIDWTVPTTNFSVANDWQTTDFQVDFNDVDNLSGIEKRFFQVADNDGSFWLSNADQGFYNDALSNLNTDWISQTGTWQISGNALVQTNQALSNTNIYTYIKQDLSNRYLYEFDMNITGTDLTRRAGFHYFCDAPQLTNRGNSYFIWFRENTNKLEFYKVENDVFSLKKSYDVNFNLGQWYNVKLVYDRITGDSFVYLDGQLVGEWKDTNPFLVAEHQNHSYISFRSGNSILSVQNLKVYRTRNAQSLISVGYENSMLRYQNPATYGGAIRSIVTDSAQNISNIYFENLNIDWTAPEILTYVNDGFGVDIDTTYNLGEISANWSNGVDPHSGIAKYYYTVGTTPGSSDLIGWTDNGTNNYFVNSSVTLLEDQLYYTTVKCENAAGLQNAVLVANGVRAVILDEPIVPTCPDSFEVCLNQETFEILGVNPNGGTFSGDGIENNVYFNPETAGVGEHLITYNFFGESCTFAITVKDLPVVSCPENILVLHNEATFNLVGALPEGGTYLMNGLPIEAFNPSLAEIGEHIITYSYFDILTNCENYCEFLITVESGVFVENSNARFINIYPNPNDGTFIV
jgi:spore germination protein YaaH